MNKKRDRNSKGIVAPLQGDEAVLTDRSRVAPELPRLTEPRVGKDNDDRHCRYRLLPSHVAPKRR